LKILLKDKSVQGDMVMLLIAYNAGPGNLAKWKKQWPEVKDPLFFIELIPSSETRAYVERVLANFWIYRLKDGQPTPTLDSLATGKIAKYTHNNVSEHKGPYQTASVQ
jgi:soluble lytic murein transglycosylase